MLKNVKWCKKRAVRGTAVYAENGAGRASVRNNVGSSICGMLGGSDNVRKSSICGKLGG
jgi:hypothetical protein